MRYFTFDGVPSTNYGVLVQNKNTYDAAERDITMQAIPGRSGDLIIDNDRRKNITIEYDCALISSNVSSVLENVRKWLSIPRGYKELSDSYMTDRYRLGICTGQIKFTESHGVATFKVSFNCKPLAFLSSGKTAITLTKPTTITNSTGITAKPYMKVTGSGNITLAVGSQTLDIRGISEYIEIDSEIESAYKGATLMNSSIYSYPFPELLPGDNAISWSGTGSVSQIDVIPRWCEV